MGKKTPVKPTVITTTVLVNYPSDFWMQLSFYKMMALTSHHHSPTTGACPVGRTWVSPLIPSDKLTSESVHLYSVISAHNTDINVDTYIFQRFDSNKMEQQIFVPSFYKSNIPLACNTE